jgi:hypothetical protein
LSTAVTVEPTNDAAGTLRDVLGPSCPRCMRGAVHRRVQLRRRVPIHLALLTALLLCSLTVGCGTGEHFFDVTGDLFVLSAADHYEEALQRAAEWSTDAYLSGIMVIPCGSKDGGSEPFLLYQFDSPTGGGSYYSVEFDGEEWISRVTQRGLSGVTPPPIDRSDWSLDSVDAWSIALANGGEDFLSHHQEPMTAIGLRLDYWGGGEDLGRLAWRVDFLILSGPSLDIFIEPQGGYIIETGEHPMPGTPLAMTSTFPARSLWAARTPGPLSANTTRSTA